MNICFCIEIERMRRRSETNLRGYSARDKMAEAAELEKVSIFSVRGLIFISAHTLLLWMVQQCMRTCVVFWVIHRSIGLPCYKIHCAVFSAVMSPSLLILTTLHNDCLILTASKAPGV